MVTTCSIHRRQVHTKWDNSLEPVERVKSGTIVTFDCVDASDGQIQFTTTVQDLQHFDMSRMIPLFGPVYVEEAQPGDALEIEFLEIKTGDYGWTAMFGGFGLLASEFAGIEGLRIWAIRDGYATTTLGSKSVPVRVPIRPFCGEIGVARGEDGAHSAVPPYATGGNIDTKHITAGSRISLPVQVEGALFSLGDGHALQGDGEVCGAAIETCVTATVRITLHPASSLPYAVRQPHYTTPPQVEVGELEREGFHTTMGIAPDLLEAAKLALNYMIEYMCGIADGAIEKEDAYMLCSVVGDLHACEVVDMPNYAMGFRMPEYVLRQIRA